MELLRDSLRIKREILQLRWRSRFTVSVFLRPLVVATTPLVNSPRRLRIFDPPN